MSEPMPKSFKESVEEFKRWSENNSKRIVDTKSGTSPRPRVMACMFHRE
tara:strand:+ start:318 stop:464 length:147 start_codon:yes stop_codon:yes gene_type:complete